MTAAHSIAKQVRTLREARGMTQTDLAIAMRTTQSAISRIEVGRWNNLTLDTLQALAGALDTELAVQFRDKTIQ